ncbi:MAG TPA: YkgJ family cysteine cluster protein [Desulfuromonadales bacterium]|nr:YkgJ family cysteine cluster protein [Desulfuromonadales bacterium]
MNEDFDFRMYARSFRAAAATLLEGARTPLAVAGGTHLLVAAVEKDLCRFGAYAGLDRVACRAGCSACCILNVSVLFPEAITISRFLCNRLEYENLLAIQARVEEVDVRTRWLTDDERADIHEPCAFLDGRGWCLVHPARPLLCRSVTSLDAALCRDALAAAPFAEARTIPMNLFQKALTEAAYLGFAAGLEQLGLDNRSWRLATAVNRLLTVPGATGDFLAGKQVARH